MKKSLCLLSLLVPLSCMACSPVDYSSIKIICPTGAPSLAFYKETQNPNFETNSVASNVIAQLNKSSDYDLVVIETVNGIKAINNGANFKLAATLTFGNFYIAATGNDDDGIMDKDDYIVIFGKGLTPDLMFHYLHGDEFDNALHYVDSVSNAAPCLISGKNATDNGASVDYVFIAQPVLYNALNKNPKASVYEDIQKSYKEKSGGKDLIQASIFVNNNCDKVQVNAYLKDLETSVNELVNDPSLFSSHLAEMEEAQAQALFGVAPSMAEATLKDNSIGLGYKSAYNNKESIDNFVELFGLNKTNEEIYYK